MDAPQSVMKSQFCTLLDKCPIRHMPPQTLLTTSTSLKKAERQISYVRYAQTCSVYLIYRPDGMVNRNWRGCLVSVLKQIIPTF